MLYAHIEGRYRVGGREGIRHDPAYYLVSPRISEQMQVHDTLVCVNVCYVGHPELIGKVKRHVLYQVLVFVVVMA